MLINQGNLNTLSTGFKTAFQDGFNQTATTTEYQAIVTEIQSQTASEEYGWLNRFPQVRKWIGDRTINQMTVSGYTLKNEHYEQTVSINRDDIEDDRYGIYGSVFRMMGEEVARFPNQHIFNLLKNGWQEKGFDGVPFFSSDHPKINADGKQTKYANTEHGNEKPWFLLDASRTLKPLLYQIRKPFVLAHMDAENDEQVFMRGEYLYGVDGRVAFGYGLPFLAWGSKQKLTTNTFNKGVDHMMSLAGDYDRVLGLRPTHLVVPPSLREQALSIISAERTENGATNINHNAVEVIVSPWLSS